MDETETNRQDCLLWGIQIWNTGYSEREEAAEEARKHWQEETRWANQREGNNDTTEEMIEDKTHTWVSENECETIFYLNNLCSLSIK